MPETLPALDLLVGKSVLAACQTLVSQYCFWEPTWHLAVASLALALAALIAMQSLLGATQRVVCVQKNIVQ